MNPDIVVIGDLVTDLLLFLPMKPRPESVVLPLKITKQVGGSGTFAIMARRLGLRVKAIECVGKDGNGFFIRESLAREGIDVNNVFIRKGETKTCIVLIYNGLKSFISLYSEKTVFLRPEDIKKEMLTGNGLYISGYSLVGKISKQERNAVYKAFKTCREKNMKIFFDAGPLVDKILEKQLLEILASTDVLFLNQAELKSLSRKLSMKTLDELGILVKGMIVLKMGEKGAVARFKRKSIYVRALKTDSIDPTWAGDCFNAGFIYGLLKGWAVERSLKLANVIGGLKTKRIGGGLNAPSKSEIQKCLCFLNKEKG